MMASKGNFGRMLEKYQYTMNVVQMRSAEKSILTIVKHELVDEIHVGKKHTTATISRKSKLVV